MRGEPDFRTPQHIIDAGTSALEAGRTDYPDQRGEACATRSAEASERRTG